jgi:dolichol-phosphate mannosyltransferase
LRPLVVIPTYNEALNVDEVLRRTLAAVPDGHVLIVDDGSPDGTAELAESIGADLGGGVDVLRRTEKQGLGAAYRAGFAWGIERGYDVLCEMDADLSHDPAALPSLLGAVDDGADLAIGSRYVAGGSIPDWTWHRRALSRYGNLYASVVLGLGVRDTTSGYRAYRADTLLLLDATHFQSHGYTFQIETAYRVARAGGSIAEVPIAFTDRVRGTSKMSGSIVIEALLRVTGWAIRDRLLARVIGRARPKRRA